MNIETNNGYVTENRGLRSKFRSKSDHDDWVKHKQVFRASDKDIFDEWIYVETFVVQNFAFHLNSVNHSKDLQIPSLSQSCCVYHQLFYYRLYMTNKRF